jgi:uncharacterized membrane protein
MNATLPTHPLIVHIPLALALLLPLLAAATFLAWWRGWIPGRRAWTLVVALQALLTLGTWAALNTGKAEEERVEGIVPEAALEGHEEAAEILLGTAAGVLVLTLIALSLPGERASRLVAGVALFGMLVVAWLAIRTGEAGGQLVYRHGAARAYTDTASPTASHDAD